MIVLSEKVIEDIKEHARQENPRECCGLVIIVNKEQQYFKCTNIALSFSEFIIDPKDYAAAEDTGEIICVVHSHPNNTSKESEADLVGCENSQLPWAILSYPQEHLNIIYPHGYEAPLLGRPFCYGILDCYTLTRDYYRINFGIELFNYPREDRWWERGLNMFLDNYEKEGFIRVSSVREHDLLLMQIAAPVPNHAAMYVGGNKILHHPMDKLSCHSIYGGWYKKVTTHILRHRSLIP